MPLGLSTTLRTAQAQAIVDAMGSGGKLKFYNGTQPATGGAATTLLATLTFNTAFGTASAGAIDVNETVTQTNTNHVSGTPTWARLTTSADAFVADISIGAGGTHLNFTGTIATGVDITVTPGCAITMGNA